ncbi:MAG: methylenetetrahydrofolate reductase [Paramuribaculum sp.]|nr:methylenetetrahydrofolate reductase [Paramuribaculum sp.]
MSESVAEFLATEHPTAFSFEILPPVRGKSIESTYRNIERLLDFAPAYINITTHRNEVSYRPTPDGGFVAVSNRRRPGTVAVAAALRERYHVRAVPHLICGDFSRSEIEDQLIDLSYLGITDLLVLRGDRPKNSHIFTSHADGHTHAAELAAQVTRFNRGVMADGSESDPLTVPFTFGVAGYPEKHEEAMNLNVDLDHLKAKVDAGASYIVTQMIFDNAKFFNFVDACRSRGITVPIIPGLKPLTSLRQLSMLPRIFHIDLPDELARELRRCTDDTQVKQVGVEWAVSQASELKESGVPSIHFYAMSAVESVASIARRIY